MENTNETSASKKFDIAALSVNETGFVELVDATGEPLLDHGGQLSITVFGPGSTQYQRAQAKRNRSIVQAVKAGAKKMKDSDQREIDATFLADCTASFNGFTYKEYTGWDMFKAAYMDASIGFISEQVNAALGNWANFSKKPASA